MPALLWCLFLMGSMNLALGALKELYRVFLTMFLKNLDKNDGFRKEYLDLIASDVPDTKPNHWLIRIVGAISSFGVGEEKSLLTYQPLLIQLKFILDTTLVFKDGAFGSLMGKSIEGVINDIENDLMARSETLKQLARTGEGSIRSKTPLVETLRFDEQAYA